MAVSTKLLTPNECNNILDRISNNENCMQHDEALIISMAKKRKETINKMYKENFRYLKKMKDK